MDGVPRPTLSRTHVAALQGIAARIMETTKADTDPQWFARELILGFTTHCLRTGLDGLLQELQLTDDADGAGRPELRTGLTAKLGTKGEFDPRGPRNAKPKQAIDCLMAVLGVDVVEDPARTISLAAEVREAVTAALAAVLDVELGAPKVREDIIAWARTRCDEELWPVFEKFVALLDDQGMRMTKQLKVPLHVDQAIRGQLANARVHVIGQAVNAALDRAKPVLAAASAEAADRIEQPISLRLTPRDVVIQRAVNPHAATAPATVARTLLADLSELTGLAWIAQERAARAYSPSHTYAVGELIEHPKFGRGTVVGVSIKRVDVEFSDGKLALVHART